MKERINRMDLLFWVSIKVPECQAEGAAGSEGHSLCCPFPCIFVRLGSCHLSLERATATEAEQQSWMALCGEWLILFLSHNPVCKMYSAALHTVDCAGSWVNGRAWKRVGCAFLSWECIWRFCVPQNIHLSSASRCDVPENSIKYH